jgi:hypothetical protein
MLPSNTARVEAIVSGKAIATGARRDGSHWMLPKSVKIRIQTFFNTPMVPRTSHVISKRCAVYVQKCSWGVPNLWRPPQFTASFQHAFFSRFIVLEKYHHVDGYRNIKRAISVNSRAKLTAVLSTYLLQHLQSGLAQVVQLPNWIRGN